MRSQSRRLAVTSMRPMSDRSDGLAVRPSRYACVDSISELLVQACEGALKQGAMPWILAGFKLLNHSMAGQPQAIPFALQSGFRRCQARLGRGGFLGGFLLLRFDRLRFPAPGHALIICRVKIVGAPPTNQIIVAGWHAVFGFRNKANLPLHLCSKASTIMSANQLIGSALRS